MNKVVSSEIKYFHKEKTMNAEKWEKAEKVHSNRDCSDGSVSHNNAFMPRFKHYNMS